VTNILLPPELAVRPYRVAFHVRTPARCEPDVHEQLRNHALERMIRDLRKQGWTFEKLSPERPRGPLPVVPIKGFPKRPPKVRGHGHTDTQPDDSLWRVSSLPTFGPTAAHLMTDEVDWEYYAIFFRPQLQTAYLHEKGAPAPPWLRS
jgi:hypothetical protein